MPVTTRHIPFAFRDYGNKELLRAAKAGLVDAEATNKSDLAAQFEWAVGQLREITHEMALVAQGQESAVPPGDLMEVRKVLERLELAASALLNARQKAGGD